MKLSKPSLLLILIALLLLLNGASPATNQNPSPNLSPNSNKSSKPPEDKSARTTQSPQNDQRGTDKVPLVIKTIKTEAEAAQEQKDREEKAANDRLLVVFTACLAFIGFLQLVVFIFQFRAFRTQAHRLRETVDVMRDTAERQLRAYVSVDMVQIFGVNSGEIPTALLTIKNSGQTPAYDLTGMGGIGMATSFETLPPSTGSLRMSKSGLSAGATTAHSHKAPQPLTSEAMAALIAGELTIWVYGEIKYRDTFHTARRTKYRFEVGGETGGIGGNMMAISEEGNEQD